MRLALIAILAFLTACTRTVVVGCPPIVEYDKAFNERLADELEALPEGSATIQAIEDYVRLRDQIRACK